MRHQLFCLIRFASRSGEMFSSPIFWAFSANSRKARAIFSFGSVPPPGRHQDLPVDLLQRLQRDLQGVGPRIGFFPLVLDPLVDQPGPLLFDGDLGGHLRFADLPLLLFDGDLGLQLVLLDRPLHLDGGVAAGVDRLVGLLEQLLAGFGLQGLGHFGRRLDRQDREAEHFDAQHLTAGEALRLLVISLTRLSEEMSTSLSGRCCVKLRAAI